MNFSSIAIEYEYGIMMYFLCSISGFPSVVGMPCPVARLSVHCSPFWLGFAFRLGSLFLLGLT